MVNAPLFSSGSLRDFLEAHTEEATARARQIPQASLRRLGAQHFADKLAAELQIEPLAIDFGGVTATTEEVHVDVSRHPDFAYFGDGEARHPGTRFNLRYPFAGLAELFTVHGTTFSSMRPSGEVEQNTPTTGTLIVAIDVPRGTDAASKLQRVREQQQNLLQQYIVSQTGQIKTFNTVCPNCCWRRSQLESLT